MAVGRMRGRALAITMSAVVLFQGAGAVPPVAAAGPSAGPDATAQPVASQPSVDAATPAPSTTAPTLAPLPSPSVPAPTAKPTPTPRPRMTLPPRGAASSNLSVQPLVPMVSHITLTGSGMVRAAAIDTISNMCSGDFGLQSPVTQPIFTDYDNVPHGTMVDVGTFTAGQELVFYLDVSQTGCGTPREFSTDSNWAHVYQIGPNLWQIDWEDLVQPGDDFNDLIVQVGLFDVPVEDASTNVQNLENGGQTADPVATYSGAFTYNRVDVAIPGRGPTPTFSRSYNSLETRAGIMGPGWTTSYSARLRRPSDSADDLLFVGPDGNTDRFTANPDGSYSPPPGVVRTLVKQANGSFVVTERSRSSWKFDPAGTLVAVSDRYGNTAAIGYGMTGLLTTIGDPAGRGSLTLGYTGDLLTSVTDWTYRTVTYQYDTQGRLWKVTDREGKTTTYGYDGTSSRITTITDARANLALTLTYDALGRVATQQDAAGLVTGATTTFAYVVNGDGTRVTTTTDPTTSYEPSFHPTTVDNHDAHGWLTQRVTHPSSAETLTESYTYDAAGNRTSVTDPRGHRTDYCFDVTVAGAAAGSRGNLTRRIDPSPTAGVARPVTLFNYDTFDNVIRTVSPKGVASSASTTCTTDLSSAINTQYATDLAYDAAGVFLLASTSRVTDPELGAQTAVTKFEYGDAANPGAVTRVIPPRGNTTTTPDYTYSTTYTYGSGSWAGMLVSSADAIGNTSTYQYDGVGRLIGSVDPLGNAAGGVPAEHTTNYVYDNEDRIRFLKLPSPLAGGPQLVSETRYDEVGNPIVRLDANGQITTNAYDERDALHQVTETPSAGTVITTQYAYDAAGNLTRMTRAAGDAANERVTDYVYDGRRLVRRETQYPSWPATSPTLVASSTYDGDGNLLVATDQLGRTTSNGYDALNRKTSTDYSDPATPDVAFAFDANGNRTSMTDGTGASSYTYDELDRVLSVTSPGPKTVGYRYDLDGNRTKLIYPDATAVTYTVDKAGQLASLLDWASRSVAYQYWPDGAVKTATNPDGSVSTYGYDNARRVTDILHQSGTTLIGQYAYALDAVGNVTGLMDGPSTPPRRASMTSTGAESNSGSQWPSASADGRYIAFGSDATNLVPGDTNAQFDIFVRDLQAGSTTRVSVATDGTQSNGRSVAPTISANGRYVAYYSWATNLVPGDTNAMADVFVRDLQTGSTTRVSVATGGTEANGTSATATMSDDGRYVAFESDATNLVTGDTNAQNDIFVRDLQTGTTTRVSVATGGAQANGVSTGAVISGDGRYVAYYSLATNLVTGDTNAKSDIFVRDLQTGTTSRVSVATGGAQANGNSTYDISISSDGRYIAFASIATNLVAGDTNGATDIFVRDVQAATTSRVSVASDGTQATSENSDPSMSADGRFVAFTSYAPNLVLSDTNASEDIFVRDVQSGTTSRVSVGPAGVQCPSWSETPSISADGHYVAFVSLCNLAPVDTNRAVDVFVAERTSAQVTSYAYDRLNRLTAASGRDGARSYAYDPLGNRASLTSGGTATTYATDRADRLTSISSPPTVASSTRPPSNNDAGWTSSGNAYASDNVYATSAPAKSATTAVKLGTFGFDSTIPANATITGVTVSVEWKVSTTSSIATLGAQAWVSGAAVGTEFVNATEPTADLVQSFSVAGLTRANLLNGVLQVRVRATRGNTNTAFTASLDAVSVKVDYTTPNTVSVTTDAVGNLLSRGSSTYAYDQANRLKTATVAGATESYGYDGDGVRFSRQVGPSPVIRYVTDPTAGLPVTIDDGTRKYVWGNGLAYAVSGTAIEVYHADRLGSVRAITDASGTITSTYRTDEFGNPTATTGTSIQPFAFTGEPRDGTGLIDLRARYYDPALGQFLSRDALPGTTTSPLSLNRYAYVEDNPLRLIDPSGFNPTSQVLGAGQPWPQAGFDPNTGVAPYDGGSNPLLLAKGGKQNLRQTGLPVDKGQLDKLYKDPNTTPEMKEKIRQQQKWLGYANKQKRSNYQSEPDLLVVGGVGAILITVGYGVYRVVRMIPSVAIPELWPTIVPNVLTP